jgi:hypothetical protein
VRSYESIKVDRKVVFQAIALAAAAFLMLCFKISAVPGNLNPDAADTLQSFMLHKHRSHWFAFYLNWNGCSAINSFLLGSAWKLSGYSVFGIRILPAMAAAASGGMLYFLLVSFGTLRSLALASSMLLLSSPAFLNFARDGWENIFVAPGVLLTIEGMRRYKCAGPGGMRAGLALLLAGCLVGVYGYHPGKLLLAAPLLTALEDVSLKQMKPWVIRWALFMILLALFSAPFVFACWSDPHAAFDRIRTVSILSHRNPVSDFAWNMLRAIRGCLLLETGMFGNDRYSPQWQSLLPQVLFPFVLVGMASQARKYGMITLFGLIVVLATQALSEGTPDAARGVHALPILALWIGLGAEQVRRQLVRVCKLAAFGPLEVLLGILVIKDVLLYVGWIQLPATLRARQPAVELSEIQVWGEEQRKEIDAGRFGFNVGDWRVRRSNERGSEVLQ